MRRRNPVPILWLITDERMGGALWRALARLPRGAGVLFRHHATPPAERRALFARVKRIARARRLVLVTADAPVRGDGVHGGGRTHGLRTWPAHSRTEALAGKQARADALFVSPVYPTRSHPGAPAIGPRRAVAIGRGLSMPIIALGGMDAKRFAKIKRMGFHGWAAIDAWTR